MHILTAHDPIGICFPDNPHREIEYSLEVNTILPRLNEAATVEDVHRIVYEEFVRWFGRSIRDTERYDLIAGEIWRLAGYSRQTG